MAGSFASAPRSRPRDSLRWIRWDLPLRVAPMIALPLVVAALTGLTLSDLGLTSPPAQVALGALLGPIMGWVAWTFRRRAVGRIVVPTGSDALLQSAYYVLLNTPAEEIVFRGVMIGWLGRLIPTLAAWVLSSLVFGLYHVPAGWGWRAVAGVTVSGFFFGALFLGAPGGPSLLLPMIVHAFATCGFLSAGPWIALRLERRRLAASPADTT